MNNLQGDPSTMTVVTKIIRPSGKPKEVRLSRYIKSPTAGDSVEISVMETSADTSQFFVTICEIVPEVIVEPGTVVTAVFTSGRWTCPQIGYEVCQSKIMNHLYNLREAADDTSKIDAFLDKCWKCKNTKAMYHGMKYESYSKFPSIRELKIEKFEMEYLNLII